MIKMFKYFEMFIAPEGRVLEQRAYVFFL